jgi:hypothetical protein
MKRSVLALVVMVLTAGALAADISSPDGLLPLKLKHVDQAWRRPDASLAGYTQVLIRPVSVSFSPTWLPRDFGEYGLKDRDVERIRSDVAEAASESFARVLSKGGHATATSAASNVLDVQVEVVDLYVNGPEMLSEPLFRTYVRSVGEMRVVITLRDSVTGEALYRLSDHKRGEESWRLEWANSVYNRVELERLLTRAAHQLRKLLTDRT